MRIALVIGLLGWLACAAPASAEDFTFNVPVRIENMRFVESGELRCRVYQNPATAGFRMVNAAPVAITVRDGAFRGTLNPVVNLPAGVRRDSIHGWDCNLYMLYRPPGGALSEFQPPVNFVAAYPLNTHQPIASERMYVSGVFSH